jgi:transposase
MEARQSRRRPVNVRELYEHLVYEWGYGESYRSVLRYVRRHWPKPKIRTWRRVETPPGAQSQTDWAEFPRVDVGEGPEPLSAFIMVLSHSRKPAIVWSRSQDQLSWLECHNESYGRLLGVAAVNRIDNVKTAIVSGAGGWGVIHPLYRAYARAVGFHIDACRPGQAQEKGKVEAKVRLSRLLVDPETQSWESLQELQRWTDQRVERWAERALCPATGQSVQVSWQEERQRLAAVPLLPEPFDVVVTRPVHRDCMVRFEDHLYPVFFRYAGQAVEVRGCLGKVQILAEGRLLREYGRHTAERILIDPSCWQGEATERVAPPPRLGRMGRRLEEIYQMPVEQRPLDLYAALAEVAR